MKIIHFIICNCIFKDILFRTSNFSDHGLFTIHFILGINVHIFIYKCFQTFLIYLCVYACMYMKQNQMFQRAVLISTFTHIYFVFHFLKTVGHSLLMNHNLQCLRNTEIVFCGTLSVLFLFFPGFYSKYPHQIQTVHNTFLYGLKSGVCFLKIYVVHNCLYSRILEVRGF